LKKRAAEIKSSYKPPKYPILQWDEKKTERNGEIETRMPVVISGDERNPKHIGSFKLPNGCGFTIAATVVQEVREWGVKQEEPKPVMMVFDTTSSNSDMTMMIRSIWGGISKGVEDGRRPPNLQAGHP
jgi:hypothetical protein